MRQNSFAKSEFGTMASQGIATLVNDQRRGGAEKKTSEGRRGKSLWFLTHPNISNLVEECKSGAPTKTMQDRSGSLFPSFVTERDIRVFLFCHQIKLWVASVLNIPKLVWCSCRVIGWCPPWLRERCWEDLKQLKTVGLKQRRRRSPSQFFHSILLLPCKCQSQR